MSQRPFVVAVAALRRQPGERKHEVREGLIPDLQVTGSRVPANAPVTADVVIEAAEGGIVVKGTVATDWEGECRRCLRPVSGRLEAPVHDVFEDKPDPELSYPITGDGIDLEPLAHDAVLLELPLAPLCADDCRGLCPSCGINRNESDCDCKVDLTDPRWAALEALKSEE